MRSQEKKTAYKREWRKKHPEDAEKQRSRNKELYHKRREVIVAAKDRPCMDCGGVFPVVCMDFDHRPGTEKKFSIGGSGPWSESAMREEIAKCDVVCANCHRVRTFITRGDFH